VLIGITTNFPVFIKLQGREEAKKTAIRTTREET